ncbi:hypothetical protein PG994_005572 [Apiospora phragmitis]|uniref:Uncharacterized protein n=1 Tax=Apiospora phragmitis TaxID=2905665 RepID=A0ABR1VCK9_9PEZI
MWLLLFTIPLTAWVYLLVLSVVAAEVFREGFLVLKPPSSSNNNDSNDTDSFVRGAGGLRGGVVADFGTWWFAWFAVVALSAAFPLLLVPAAGLPVLLLRHPAFRLVVDFGLVRLGWTAAVYNPAVFWYGCVLRPLAAAAAVRAEWVARVVQCVFAAAAS